MKIEGYYAKVYFVFARCVPGVHQACRRVAVHYVFARCVPGVCQACARRAPGVRVSGVRQVTSVRQVCARRAPGVHWGVCQACARRAQTYYQLANILKID